MADRRCSRSGPLLRHGQVRRIIHNNEWWFVIVDVVAALTDSADPQGYVKDMRRRDPELAKGWGQMATPLSIATGGGPQNLNCANTEGLFRIIQKKSGRKVVTSDNYLALTQSAKKAQTLAKHSREKKKP